MDPEVQRLRSDLEELKTKLGPYGDIGKQLAAIDQIKENSKIYKVTLEEVATQLLNISNKYQELKQKETELAALLSKAQENIKGRMYYLK